ncbi:phosphoribosylanthranilate isomerase [Oscillatoria sp. FACHB-1407]|uniref:phosphoribosylanthranilate isomerase n=1 Tax=Oscillatoria sp. FACHB-1407 TaxID=2692847 RepID=UPI00168894C4|nr:phosphoribosylanthranilate isomerase [Oscillatoria sp. FACHB-1407]MBD2459790.1 phosphoribosylanthranilate isomerase [Oscillatoria sp. FACHB-1407]
MKVKICGITQPEQGRAIADLGASALGFMCVSQSPRFVTPEQIQTIIEALDGRSVDRVGVFANASIEDIKRVVAIADLNVIQLHGSESPDFCAQLQVALPQVSLIKALRIRTGQDLQQADRYQPWVAGLLLDAYHPNLLGGTGTTLDWASLKAFRPNRPWLLAGGITPANVAEALKQVNPDGIDLSSGVERSPGDKDLEKVARLFEVLETIEPHQPQGTSMAR